MSNDRGEIGFGLQLGFHRANEALETAQAVEFVLIADPRCDRARYAEKLSDSS